MNAQIDRLGRMASDMQTRCEEYHAQLTPSLKTCRCDEEIAVLDDARALVLRLEEERDNWQAAAQVDSDRVDQLREERERLGHRYDRLLSQHLVMERDRDALLEALKDTRSILKEPLVCNQARDLAIESLDEAIANVEGNDGDE